MKFDIRVNNVFVAEIDGVDILSALENAGIDADFTMMAKNCGFLHFESDEAHEALLHFLFSDPGKDNSEAIESINEDKVVTFGPAD